MATFDLKHDLKSLGIALSECKRGMRNRILRRAMLKGNTPHLKAARRHAPVETGQLAKSLTKIVRVYGESGNAIAIVGIAPGSKNPVTGRDPHKYLHLVHGGTQPHAVGRGSNLRAGIQIPPWHPGAKANPFLARANAEVEEPVTQIVGDEVYDLLVTVFRGGSV